MSKYNLYNLSRVLVPNYRVINFFQQKWKSKSALRDYHGEQVREKQWERMFSRRIRSVVPMDPAYLASNDGSNESAGRGSGLEQRGGNKPVEHTPHMLMTFAPLERRLDVAVFRSLFASSARQARQFVVHGAVKVNGKVVSMHTVIRNQADNADAIPWLLPKSRRHVPSQPRPSYVRAESTQESWERVHPPTN